MAFVVIYSFDFFLTMATSILKVEETGVNPQPLAGYSGQIYHLRLTSHWGRTREASLNLYLDLGHGQGESLRLTDQE